MYLSSILIRIKREILYKYYQFYAENHTIMIPKREKRRKLKRFFPQFILSTSCNAFHWWIKERKKKVYKSVQNLQSKRLLCCFSRIIVPRIHHFKSNQKLIAPENINFHTSLLHISRTYLHKRLRESII